MMWPGLAELPLCAGQSESMMNSFGMKNKFYSRRFLQNKEYRAKRKKYFEENREFDDIIVDCEDGGLATHHAIITLHFSSRNFDEMSIFQAFEELHYFDCERDDQIIIHLDDNRMNKRALKLFAYFLSEWPYRNNIVHIILNHNKLTADIDKELKLILNSCKNLINIDMSANYCTLTQFDKMIAKIATDENVSVANASNKVTCFYCNKKCLQS